MSNINDRYTWEIELKDSTVVTNHNNFNADDVVRVSYIPNIPLLPRHDIIFVKGSFKFVKRFSRVSLTLVGEKKERLHCVVTDKFRLYIKSSNGQMLLTEKDYEWHLQ